MKLTSDESAKLAWELHSANFSGGSAHGMSYWADAARCGMRALLNERDKARVANDHLAIPPLSDESKDKKAAFAVGSAYHKLHELARNGELKLEDHETIAVDPESWSASHLEALRLFNGWMAHWPLNLWGKTYAIEKEITVDVAGYPVSAKPDLVVDVPDLPYYIRAQARCPKLPSCGKYLIDFKTSDQPYEDMYYKTGLQALWYCWAWNKRFPEDRVQGIIFDTIYKFGRRKDKSITSASFGAIYVDAVWSDEAPLIGMIKQGHDNIERARREQRGNRSECHQFSFGGTHTCKWYANGCNNEVA